MSVCGAVRLSSRPDMQTDLEDQGLSSLERELRQLDECRSWGLFYERIQNLASVESCTLGLSAANESENRWKNRYRDIIPYDETRVFLENESTGDYINANFVKVKEVPSRRYILTQGPLFQTAGHFWRMIMEQKCPVIIMLNRFTEKGTLKCFNYFPENTETLNFPDAKCSVTCISQENKRLYVLRTLEIINSVNKETRGILHFHYTRWPDFGVPDYSSSLLNLLWDVRRTGSLDDPDRPAVVHCSAGVGRSGTFVLIDLALTMIEKQNSMDGVDLPQLLIQLRQCRMGIIQTAQQLRYSYVAVVEGGRLLLSTPPEERAALVFPERDRISLVGNEENTSDTDDGIDSEEADIENNNADFTEVGIQDDEIEILRSHQTRAIEQGIPFHSNYLLSLNSSSSSAPTDGEDEVEIMELFNQSLRKSHLYFPVQNHCQSSSTKLEELHDNEVEKRIDMPLFIYSRVQSDSTNQVEETASHEPSMETDSSPLPAEVIPAAEVTPAAEEDEMESEPTESVKVEAVKNVEEHMGSVEEGSAVLDLLRQRREARLARQAQTRARLAAITARMAEKHMLRHRWLSERIAQPLRTFFTRSGIFNNLTEAILFTLGVFSLLVGILLGLWWHHCS